jgi:nicotinate-nucleotide pyrophosphorylase (carboxylating)
MFMPRKVVEEKLEQMLAEDVGQGDVTSEAVVPAGLTANAEVLAKEEGIAAGIEEIVIFGESLGLNVNAKVADGDEIKKDTVILKISGNARVILSAERTLLNLLSRMSGIATLTRRLAEKLLKANLKVKVAATRKTAPGLLYFDKKAVLVGGGDPHRLRLDDMILLKDNHIVIAGSVERAVKKAKAASSDKKIETEVTSTTEALKAAEAGADIVMLDNFSAEQVRDTVAALKKAGFFGKILLEVSGGITEENLLDYALAQVDVISMGALTHSVKALDISLEIVNTN